MNVDYSDAASIAQRQGEILHDLAGSLDAGEALPTARERTKYDDCYIFDYQKFDTLSSRPGSEKDVERLTHDFSLLNFEVHNDFLNLTKERTMQELVKAAKNVHERSEYFVCCFLTHGSNGTLAMSDENLNIDEILKCFSRSACPQLSGKPKIFIFQACRGSCSEEGVTYDSIDFDEDISSTALDPNIPDYRDFLLVYSTYKGKCAFRTKDPENGIRNYGSFFIDELCRTLEQFSDSLDLLQILTLVNYRIAHFFLRKHKEAKHRNKKQMSGFTSFLTSQVRFSGTRNSMKPFESAGTRYFNQRRLESWLGRLSVECPQGDKLTYKIEGSDRINFLFILNTRKNFESLNAGVRRLMSVVDNRGCQNQVKQDWSKEELMYFLNQRKARSVKDILANVQEKCKRIFSKPQEIRKADEDKISDRDFSNTDCLICFIACQAKGDYLYDFHGNKFLMRQIVDQFTGKVCPTLRRKPKIFIFLTFTATKKSWWPSSFAKSKSSDDVDGGRVDRDSDCVDSDCADTESDGEDSDSADSDCVDSISADSDSAGNNYTRTIPVHADLLEAAITIQESKQLDCVIEKLCGIFGGGSSEDFLSQLTKMNDELVQNCGFHFPSKNKLASFSFNSTLTKTLIL